MNIEINEYKYYRPDEILNLYNSTIRCSYTNHPEILEHAFEHSLEMFRAHDGEKLAGIIRAIGDGYSVLFIQDILILPEYQRKGIGTKLLKSMLDLYPDVYQIQLVTDNTEKTIAFYKSCGFLPYSEIGCEGFIKIKY